MRYNDIDKRVREILASVGNQHELNLPTLLGDMEYGVLEKVLASEVSKYVIDLLGAERFSVPRIGIGIAIRRPPNQVLLQYRLGKHACNCWAFPGGHLEMWESFEQTAVRETREECGDDLVITIPQFWTAINTMYTLENKHYVTVLMISDWVSGNAKVMEPDKTRCWEWHKWHDMPKPLIGGIHIAKEKGLDPFIVK